MLNSALDARLRPNFDDDRDADTFLLRLERYAPELIGSLEAAYGPERTPALLDEVLEVMLLAFHNRPGDLKQLDEARLLRPDWAQESGMLGYVAGAARFAGNLQGVRERLEYLRGLGVTSLHLTDLFQVDGSGATQGHHAVRPEIGTLDDLSALARSFRAQGIHLSVDVPLDKVAATHPWAQRAAAGDPQFTAYFVPPTSGAPAWTLDWSQPAVFRASVDLLLVLAGRGAEVLRLSGLRALAAGAGPAREEATLRALRACVRVVAPAVLFQAGADAALQDRQDSALHDTRRWLGERAHHGQLCDLAEHPTLTGGLWASLHAADTAPLVRALQHTPPKPDSATWTLNLRGGGPDMTALLGDLDSAAAREDEAGTNAAISRLRLLHALILGFGGLPALHHGNELGQRSGPPERALAEELREGINTPAGRVFAWTLKLVAARRALPHLHARVESRALPSPDPRVLLLRRDHPLGVMLGVYNFSAESLPFPASLLRDTLEGGAVDHLSGERFTFGRPTVRLDPYRALWLTSPEEGQAG